MVCGSRNAEKKKKRQFLYDILLKSSHKICKIDNEIEWNHSAKVIFTWKINRNNYVNQIEASVLAPMQQNDELIRKIKFRYALTNPVSGVLPS